MVKDRSFERYFVVHATLFNEDVFTTAFCILSRHIFVGQQSVRNLLPDDKNFVGQNFF